MKLGVYLVNIIFTSLAMPSAALRHDEGNDLGISCKVVKSPNTIHFTSSLSMFTSQVPLCPVCFLFLFVFRNGEWKNQPKKNQHFGAEFGKLRISGCHQYPSMTFHDSLVEVASCFDWDPRGKLSSIQETALRKCIADTSKAVLWDYEDDVGVAVGSEASVNEGKEYTLLKCNKYVVELWLKK